MAKEDGYETYVHKVRSETSRWLAQLKGENEKLRQQVVALDSERHHMHQEKLRLIEQLVTVREELSSHLEEHTALIRRLTSTEKDTERVNEQLLGLEAQNANLANLYVAAYQLRSSLERAKVLEVIKEIIVNFVGSENFAIYAKHGDHLEAIGWFEDRPTGDARVPLGKGIIGRVGATGEPFIAAPGDRTMGVTACIPLRLEDGETLGAIAIFSLLPQKDEVVGPLDRELLDLLSTQAGVALLCATLYAEHRGRSVA